MHAASSILHGAECLANAKLAVWQDQWPLQVNNLRWQSLVYVLARAKKRLYCCRLTPQLSGVREEIREDRYCLVLEFRVKKDMTEKMWTDRQGKIQTFFGPGVTADIEFPAEQQVHVYLTSDGR